MPQAPDARNRADRAARAENAACRNLLRLCEGSRPAALPLRAPPMRDRQVESSESRAGRRSDRSCHRRRRVRKCSGARTGAVARLPDTAPAPALDSRRSRLRLKSARPEKARPCATQLLLYRSLHPKSAAELAARTFAATVLPAARLRAPGHPGSGPSIRPPSAWLADSDRAWRFRGSFEYSHHLLASNTGNLHALVSARFAAQNSNSRYRHLQTPGKQPSNGLVCAAIDWSGRHAQLKRALILPLDRVSPRPWRHLQCERHATCHVCNVDHRGFSRSPKIAVPMRISVAPSSMATSKSWLMPIDSTGSSIPMLRLSWSRRSRSFRK